MEPQMDADKHGLFKLESLFLVFICVYLCLSVVNFL